MIWKCTEILAVMVECMIVTRMLIQYFKFRSKNYRILKWLLLFLLLFATDMVGTFGVANETFLILSCLLYMPSPQSHLHGLESHPCRILRATLPESRAAREKVI